MGKVRRGVGGEKNSIMKLPSQKEGERGGGGGGPLSTETSKRHAHDVSQIFCVEKFQKSLFL